MPPSRPFSVKTLIKAANQPLSPQDYRVHATSRRDWTGRFLGVLKVLRIRDGRILYPFLGVSDIGPFDTPAQAKTAAEALGVNVVASDIATPE